MAMTQTSALQRAPFTIGFLLGLAFWVGVQAGIVLTLFAFWWRPPL